MEEEFVFTAKTVDEAIEEGLKAQGLTLDEAEIVILEEGKKKLFGSIKARVQVKKKITDGQRAVNFIDGLMEILKISAVGELVKEDDDIVIEIKATNSAKIIGKHGDVLDAIQCLAGAVANTGKDDYKKVVVDCESYRKQREETLVKLAERLAAKAVEKGRKINLEPMSPYERRIIHSALSGNEQVKTVSEGKDPNRYIAVIPNNADPNDRGIHYGERKGRGDGRNRHGRGDRKRGGDRGRKPSGGKSGAVKKGKKEIHFGTFLGNSGNKNEE